MKESEKASIFSKMEICFLDILIKIKLMELENSLTKTKRLIKGIVRMEKGMEKVFMFTLIKTNIRGCGRGV